MTESKAEELFESAREGAKRTFSDCAKECRVSKNLLDIEKTISGAISHIARLEQCLWNATSGTVVKQSFYSTLSELDEISFELSEKLKRVNEEIRLACSLDPAVQALIRGIFKE